MPNVELTVENGLKQSEQNVSGVYKKYWCGFGE